MDPDRPDDAVADPMKRAPVLPDVEIPELRIILPEIPVDPELAVFSNISPLEPPLPKPVVIDIRPPVSDVDKPDDNKISPPEPLDPDPTVT